MNKKRRIKFIVAGSLAAVAGLALTSCGSKTTKYTVSFDVNDPDTTDSITLDEIDSVTVKKGSTVTLTDLTYEGYTFGGWYTDEDCTTEFTSSTTVESDLTLYAKWTKNADTFTVTFNTNGGSSIDAVEVEEGSTVTAPTDPTLDGYTFDGWYTDSALTTAFDFSTAITADITLYAKWTAESSSGIDIPDGYEEVTEALDLATVINALGTGKQFASSSYTSGSFTLDESSDLELRTRGKTWTKKGYDGYDSVDLYTDIDGNESWTSTGSVKLTQSAGISFTAAGTGNCRVYVQNGSSGAGDSVTLTIKDTTDGTSTEIAFPAAVASSPMVQVSFDVTEGHGYQVLRTESGTIDCYKIELDMAVEEAEVSSIAVTAAGTSSFFAGTEFNTTGLSVKAVKANGASIALSSDEITVDSSAVDMTTAGTYAVKITYGAFETSYDVTVYSLEDMELGFNSVAKATTNTSAGNQQYINSTVQQVYGVGDTIDFDALTIIGYAADDAYYQRFTEESSYVTTDAASIDMTTAGKKTITVTLTLNGVSKTETFDIYVASATVATVTEDSVVTEANVYVDPSYTGVVGTQVTYGSISKTCNTFTTIQQALDFLGQQEDLDAVRKNVYIAAGTYNEKLELTLPYLSLIGISGADSTIIEYDSVYGVADEGGFSHTTDSTQTVAIRYTATNCIIDGITISNYYNDITDFDGTDYEGTGERALALLCQADQVIVQDSKLLGWQDTLELFTGRQLFKNTYISGCVDYIFGTNNTTLFEGCEIHTVKSKTSYTDDSKVTAYLTAFKGCNKGESDAITYGAIFNDCDFTTSDDFIGKIAVGRCWGAYSAVAILNSRLCDDIVTTCSQTIVSMNAKNTVTTLQYWFYNNTLADGTTAVTFTEDISTVTNHVLTAAEAANYVDYDVIFGKSNRNVSWTNAWDPSYTGVVVDDCTYYYFNGGTSATGTVYNYTGSVGASGDASKTTTLGDLSIDATTGKFTARTSDTQWNAGTTISIAVEAGTQITVANYPGYAYYSVQGTVDTTVKYANADTVNYYFASAQTVTFTATNTVYLYSIIVNPDEEAPTDPTISSLTLSTSSVQTTYDVGDTLSTDGIVVNANYSDGTYIVLGSTAYTIDTDAVDMTTAGTYQVVVKLASDETIYATYNVTVNEASTSIATNTNITFGSSGNYTTVSKLDTSAATLADNSNDTTSTQITGTLTFPVLAGAKVYVYGYANYTNYTIQAGTQDASETITSQHYIYEVTAESTVTITCGSNCYLYGIYIVYPIDETTTYTYGATEDASTNTYDLTGSTGNGLIFEGAFNTNNTIQFKSDTDNAIVFYVKAGATVVVTGHSASYGILTVTAGTTTVEQDGATYTYTATADTSIIITPGASGRSYAYVRAISVTYSES